MEETKKSFNPFFILAGIIIVVIIVALIFLNNKKAAALSANVANSPESSPISSIITLEEIAKHSDQNSCWMTIEGNVYDVSAFVPKHPGEEAILQGCGKDATAMFNSRPSNGTSHSTRARSTLSGFQIGTLAK